MDRLRRAIGTRLGKAVLGTTLALGAAGGIAEGAHVAHEHHKAQYEATQGQIAPIIENTMVNIDVQTLGQQRSHPDKVTEIDNPDGRSDAVEFINDTHNTVVIMGKTEDGKPDPAKPLFVRYNNNTGTGEGTNGIRVVLTAPGGNKWVDQDPYIGFGGSTEGGWGATVAGRDDTTDRGYANNSMPAPLEAAQEIAQTVQEFGPYDTYSLPK
ncbi:MAG TPA: hypothetical protein VGO07_04000 [Candidatus Saccharimonadales bacterium]|nr:hypothetical protein [Candidatus Saccharimonadales bacterium]